MSTSHPATVLHVSQGLVKVRVTQTSACASCAARAKCGLIDQKENIVNIPTRHWQQYHPGQTVTLLADSRNGLLAVLFAYILPALLLLATFIVLYTLHLSEILCATLTLAAIIPYLLILYLLRHRLHRQFQLTIQPQ